MQNVVAQICSDIGTTRINIETTNVDSGYPEVSKLGNNILVSYTDVDTWESKNKIVDENGNVSDMLSTSISPSTNDNSDSVIYKGLSNGNVLVYWYSSSSGTGFTDAYFKIINSSGVQIVGPTKINTLVGSLNRFVESEQLSNGNIIFTWATSGSDYSMRRFTQTGIAVDANQISLTSLAGLTGQSQYAYKIAANANGKFMILIDYYSLVYKAMIFNNDALTPIQVNGANSFTAATAGISGQHVDKIPNIVSLPNNKFLLAYQIQTGTGTETRSLALKVYNEDGSVAVDQKVIRQLYSWGSIYKPVVTPTGFYLSSMYNDLGYGPGLGAKSFLEKYDFDCNLISDLSNCFSGLDEYATVLPFNDINDDLGFLINNTEGTANYNIWILRNIVSCTAPAITGNPPNRSICAGSNTTFSSTATGATAYQWQVNTGSGFANITNGGVYSNATTSTLTITGAAAGMNGYQYRCVAKDGSCSTNSSSGTLNVSNITSSTVKNDVLCFGNSTGYAVVSPTGGIGSYTYSWSPSGGTGSIATGLAAGTYTVTITDAIGCQITKTITINQPAALTATSSSTTVSCNGGSNGTATVVASGGTPGYTYSWAPSGGTAATATGLAAGTYSVTITDANSCTKTITGIVVGQPAAALNGTTTTTTVSCFGGSNGTATVVASGGTPGYTYSWAPSGGTAATATGLAAGTYSVTITDAKSCQITINNIVVGQPAAALNGSTTTTAVSCFGGSNGIATVTPSGGTSGYTYSWSPSGGTSATATGLAAGTYSVTITDANSCTKTITGIVVGQPSAALNGTITTTTPVSCNGGSNGTATVVASGGTPGYTYSWAPSGGTATTATGLAAGTYSVTITDAKSCQITINNIVVGQPAAISFTTTALSGYDYNTSYTQNVVATGGTGAKTYAITAGSLPNGLSMSTSGVISGTSTQVADSNFTVTATDANSCTAAYSFTLKLNQIPITVTADASQTKVYGSSDPVLTYTVNPALLSGDSFTGALSRAVGENVGSSYAINQGDLSAGNKYLITFVSKDFAITAKPITVTANVSQTKVYGTADPTFTYSVSPSL
ncbi:MBG domain-containing protein, partial [Flavobacterium pokkalii]